IDELKDPNSSMLNSQFSFERGRSANTELAAERRRSMVFMKLRLLFIILASSIAAFAAAQTQAPQSAEQVFKNVQVLKGIPVAESMTRRGAFLAGFGMSCDACNAANDSKWENYALDTSPKKRTARRMIQMVTAINKDNFGGRQMVTCWTCHRGTDHPKVTPNL